MPPGICKEFVKAISEELQQAGRAPETALAAAIQQAFLRFPEVFLLIDFLDNVPFEEDLVRRTLLDAIWLRGENYLLHEMMEQTMSTPLMCQMYHNAEANISKGKGKGKDFQQSFTAFSGSGQSLESPRPIAKHTRNDPQHKNDAERVEPSEVTTWRKTLHRTCDRLWIVLCCDRRVNVKQNITTNTHTHTYKRACSSRPYIYIYVYIYIYMHGLPD